MAVLFIIVGILFIIVFSKQKNYKSLNNMLVERLKKLEKRVKHLEAAETADQKSETVLEKVEEKAPEPSPESSRLEYLGKNSPQALPL